MPRKGTDRSKAKINKRRKWQGKFESQVALVSLRRDTFRRYSVALEHFNDVFPTLGLEQFRATHGEDYKQARLSQSMAPTTIFYELQVIRTYFNWLVKQGVLDLNPFRLSCRVRPEKDPRFREWFEGQASTSET